MLLFFVYVRKINLTLVLKIHIKSHNNFNCKVFVLFKFIKFCCIHLFCTLFVIKNFILIMISLFFFSSFFHYFFPSNYFIAFSLLFFSFSHSLNHTRTLLHDILNFFALFRKKKDKNENFLFFLLSL